MRVIPAVLLIGTMLSGVARVTLAAEAEAPVVRERERTSGLGGSSDLFAAFLVAAEEQSRWWKKEKGVDLTPAELAKRHEFIRVVRESDSEIEVSFGPEKTLIHRGVVPEFVGGMRTIVVDPRSWEIRRAFFER